MIRQAIFGHVADALRSRCGSDARFHFKNVHVRTNDNEIVIKDDQGFLWSVVVKQIGQEVEDHV